MSYQDQLISTDVLVEKYLKGEEKDQLDNFKRVAIGVAQAEKPELRDIWATKFLENMRNGALGAGRIMSNAGTDVGGTLINCFVQPVADSIQDYDGQGHPGIYIALKEAAETMRRGGGVGYNFSSIRPKNAKVKGTSSFASGPCSYIDVFDVSCRTVESAGGRRGAQLGALRVDHPDVEEFITAKRQEGRWSNFNVSVFVSDVFMEAVKTSADWPLVHKAEPTQEFIDNGAYKREDGLWVYKTVNAKELWDTIMKSNYDFAEPGILFADNINNVNNLNYVEVIEATNPCGEQPLPPYGCCDLGPINLPMFVKDAFTTKASFDFKAFKEAVKIQVRFLDNVLDVTHWPLEQQDKESQSKRRIGVGFTGLGNALAMLTLKYNSQEGRDKAAEITSAMSYTAYDTSVDLAIEKGSFPLFNAELYLKEGTYASTLPTKIKNRIRKYGIRNSHLTSIAPVGTISLAFCDNASNGIEPPFDLAYKRSKRMPDGSKKEYKVVDHSVNVYLDKLVADGKAHHAEAIYNAITSYSKTVEIDGLTLQVRNVLPESIITALEMTADEHLLMVAAVQKYNDTSISKTVNVAVDYPFEDFKNLYLTAHKLGLKGVSTYRPNNILGSVLSVGVAEVAEVKAKPIAHEVYETFMTEDHPARPAGRLNGCFDEHSYYNSDGEVRFYLGISFLEKEIELEDGSKLLVKRPVEVFINSEMNVGNEWAKLLGKTFSQMARFSIYKLAKYIKTCLKVKSDRGNIRFGYITKQGGDKVPRYHGSDIAVLAYAIQEILKDSGNLDASGDPVNFNHLFEKLDTPVLNYVSEEVLEESTPAAIIPTGAICTECGSPSVGKRDGCKFCSNCGWQGSCG